MTAERPWGTAKVTEGSPDEAEAEERETALWAKLKETSNGEISEQDKANLAAGAQAAIVDVLGFKAIKAMKETGLKRLVVAGGVGANLELRQFLKDEMRKISGEVFFPPHALCTDNGAMIAHAASERVKAGLVDLSKREYNVSVRPRWDLAQI